jgi:hypothetical protein
MREGERKRAKKNGRGEKEIAPANLVPRAGYEIVAPAGKPYVFSSFASVSGREILIG